MINKSRNLLIRNIDEYTYLKISEFAEEAGMKRETYLRQILQNFAISGQVKAMEDKYTSLVNSLTEYIKMQGDIIEQNTILLNKIMEGLDV